MDWAEKYRPKCLEEIVGNGPSIRQIYEWAATWSRDSRPLILYGKPGTGKTSAAYALAADMGWEVLELNASDQRTKAVIEKVAGTGSTTCSLTGSTRKLIVLDEADNLQGTADRGGAKAIVDIIKNSRQPIMLIANDLYGVAPEIRSRCDQVQFRALQARSIASRLRFICSAEEIQCSSTALADLAKSAGGDLRAAINMLYASSAGKGSLEEGDIHTSRKDERSTIFQLIAAIFGDRDDEEMLRLSFEVDETPDTVEQWIEANIHHMKNPAMIADAYRHLARADEYIGYTFRQQYYTLWRYASSIMLLGVADSASGCGIHARISSPERWRKMGTYRKQRASRAGLLNKLSMCLHMPQQTLRETYLGPLNILIDRDPLRYARELELDADQLNLLIHDNTHTKKIMKELAAERKEKERQQDLAEKIQKKQTIKTDRKQGNTESDEKKPGKRQSTLFEGFSA